MNAMSAACRDEPLHWLLNEPEESARYREAAEHVSVCSRCQRRLEELVARQGDWEETRELLRPDETVEGWTREWMLRSSGGDGVSTEQARQASELSETQIRQFLAPPSHPEMLGRLGRYEVERWIGSGGMGVVLKAFDTELNRPVAIKLLAPHLATNGAARQRFAREARAAAAVVHEHVVAIYDVRTDGPLPYLVMQYVAGESLQARLDRGGPLETVAILRVAHQTAAGLSAAHHQGLVHRDVKPSNILLVEGVERALLTDFGLARANDDASLTHTGYLPGTPHYMSPEQARGESIDARSDLFSLGAVLYTMACGRPPFRAETSLGVLRRITDATPRPVSDVNPDVPDWLEAIIARLLEKSPDSRHGSAAELAGQLEGCLAHLQQPTTVALPPEVRQWTWAWRARTAGVMPRARRFNGLVRRTVDFLVGTRGRMLATSAAIGLLLLGGSWSLVATSPRSDRMQADSPASPALAPRGFPPAAAATNPSDWDSVDRAMRELEATAEELPRSEDDFWADK